MASRRAVIPVAVAGILVVTAGGVGAYATVRGPSGSYRTAVAGERSVRATLSTTGTVGPAASATVAFPIAGTVDSVPVAPGDSVAADATLATVDTAANGETRRPAPGCPPKITTMANVRHAVAIPVAASARRCATVA